MNTLELRLPRLMRWYVRGFSLFWCGTVTVFVVVLATKGAGAVFVPILMLAFGVTLAYRLWRLGVSAHGDELVVRNHFRTRRLRRAEVEGFRMAPAEQLPFTGALYVLLRDDTLMRLDVTIRPTIRRFGKATLETQLAELRRWLAQPAARGT